MHSGTARIAYALAAVVAVAGCYDIPRPECGFTCGPPAVPGGEGTCPDGYVCFTSVDNRCHRVSPPFTDTCPGDASLPPDLTPPQLVFRSPAPDSVDVPVTMTGFIEIAFDEPVARLADFPNFIVEDATTIIPGSVVDLGPGSDGYHYQYQTQTPLRHGTTHTVRVTEQVIDLAGNAFIGAEWTFRTVEDNTPPMANVVLPTIMSNVPINTFVEVQFTEPVQNVNTTTLTLNGPSGNVSGSLNAGVSTFARFVPNANLVPNSQYTVNLSTTITDLAGNALSGFTPFVFTTAVDTTSPNVTNVNPANNQTNVSVVQSVSIAFSESVLNVNNTTFTLTGPSGTETALVTTGATSATLNPVYQLAPNTTYMVAASTAITDAVGNPLVAFASMFTTGLDNIVPSVIGRFPTSGATNVPVDTVVRVDFDEHVTNLDETTFQLMNGGAVAGTVVYQGPPERRGTLTPTSQLAANTTYTVVLASTIQDPSGNMFGTPPGAWTFMTGADTIVPSVVTTDPVDGTTDVALDAAISVTFDEPVTGVDDTSFVVMNAGTGTLASSNGGRTWTFTPDAPMPASTTITIMLTMAIEDAAGNDLVPFAFDFTTVP